MASQHSGVSDPGWLLAGKLCLQAIHKDPVKALSNDATSCGLSAAGARDLLAGGTANMGHQEATEAQHRAVAVHATASG